MGVRVGIIMPGMRAFVMGRGVRVFRKGITGILSVVMLECG